MSLSGNGEGAGRSDCQMTLSSMKGCGEWERCLKTEGKSVSHLSSKRQKGGKLEVCHPHLYLWKCNGITSECHLQQNEREKVINNSQHGFTTLEAFYDVMIATMDEGKEEDVVYLILARLLTLFS